MQQIKDIISKFFPEEKIVNSHSVSLKKEVSKVFNIPLSYFKDPKINLYKGIELVETDNYWFIDTRHKVRSINRVVSLLSITIFLFFFGNQFFQLEKRFLIMISIPMILYSIVYLISLNQGLQIKVYKKNWVKVKKDGNKLTLETTLPKYYKDEVWKLIYGNKLLDFIGLTISSAETKTNYLFKIEKHLDL